MSKWHRHIQVTLIIAACVLGGVIILILALRSHFPVVIPDHTPVSVSKPSPIDARMSSLSIQQKVARLFMFHAPGTDVAAMASYIATYQPGGMILMGDNIADNDASQRAMTTTVRGGDLAFPRLVATDEEGGIVHRLPADTFAAADRLRTEPVSATTTAFTARSNLLQSIGMTVNFGIVADTTADPESFIYDRVLGTTPVLASQRVVAAVTASRHKTLSALKHFPGHGETEVDSHHAIPTTDLALDDWRQRDALPFEAGIAAGADIVMVGQLRYSAVDSLPATLSSTWHTILRRDLHFNGLIITDDMCMLQDSDDPAYANPVQNAVDALQAGNDMLLYVLNNDGSPHSLIDPQSLINGVVAAVQSGELSQATIDTALRYVLQSQMATASLTDVK